METAPLRSTSPILQPFTGHLCSQRFSAMFTGATQQLVVELRAEKERRFEQLIQFGTNGSNVARALGFEQEAKGANHIEARRLGQSSGGAIVDDNGAGLQFDSQGDGLPLAITKPSSRREP